MLAVDDFEGLDLLSKRLYLRDDHSTHKMRNKRHPVFIDALRYSFDVLPEQFKLGINIPSILTLVKRNEETFLAVKKFNNGTRVWLHFDSLLYFYFVPKILFGHN